MAGILQELFNVRTHGNGRIRSHWDDVLLMRDLEQLIAEERVQVLKVPPRAVKTKLGAAPECAKKWFLDCANGDVYSYTEPWERGEARFDKCILDDLFPLMPDQQPM